MISNITLITLLVVLINSCGSEEATKASEPVSEPEQIDGSIYTETGRTVPANPDPMPSPVEKKVVSNDETAEEEIVTWDGPTVNLVTISNPLGYRWDVKPVLSKPYLPDGYTIVLVTGTEEPTECTDSNVTDSSIWIGDLYLYPTEPGTYWIRVCIMDNATGLYSEGKSKSYEVVK